MSENIYAKVIDGIITEYPVLESYVINRSDELSSYSLCVFDVKPEIKEFEYLTEVKKYDQINNVVNITYTINMLDLVTVLTKIQYKNVTHPFIPGSKLPDVIISDLNEYEINILYLLVKNYITDLLDKFAQSRGYDNIVTISTYVNSTVQEYRNEANRALLLRDQTWSSANLYFNKIVSGETPIPKTIDDIVSQLPVLTW